MSQNEPSGSRSAPPATTADEPTASSEGVDFVQLAQLAILLRSLRSDQHNSSPLANGIGPSPPIPGASDIANPGLSGGGLTDPDFPSDLFFPTHTESLSRNPVFEEVAARVTERWKGRKGKGKATESTVNEPESAESSGQSEAEEEPDQSPTEDENGRFRYPRSMPSFHAVEESISLWSFVSQMWCKKRPVPVRWVDFQDHSIIQGRGGLQQLRAVLEETPRARFIHLGGKKPSKEMMEAIFSRYEVSPLFLHTVTVLGDLGGPGTGVCSKLLVTASEPQSVRGFHFWYSVPYRDGTPCIDTEIPGKHIDETPSRGILLRRSTTAIAGWSMRVYTAYDKSTDTCTTITHMPDHAWTSVVKGLRACSWTTDSYEDPFGFHLLYCSYVLERWKLVIWFTSMEMSILENEALNSQEKDIRGLIRMFQTLSIHLSRWSSELQIGLDILDGLLTTHGHFYELVLEQDTKKSYSFHRIHAGFQNCKAEFKIRLVNVAEFERRMQRATKMLFYAVKNRSDHRLLSLTTSMDVNNRNLRQLAEQGQKNSVAMTKIAKETREDSFAMKTIAVVTMFYLPPAFITTVFGSQIIQLQGDPGNEVLSLVKPWWIYVLLVVLFTSGTFGVWVVWMWWSGRIVKRKQHTAV